MLLFVYWLLWKILNVLVFIRDTSNQVRSISTVNSNWNWVFWRFVKKNVKLNTKDVKTSVFYLGLFIISISYGNVVSGLIDLLATTLTKEFFEYDKDLDPETQNHIQLYKIFDSDTKLSLRITNQIEKEYCCFYHFLIGKRRVMVKSNKINVE